MKHIIAVEGTNIGGFESTPAQMEVEFSAEFVNALTNIDLVFQSTKLLSAVEFDDSSMITFEFQDSDGIEFDPEYDFWIDRITLDRSGMIHIVCIIDPDSAEFFFNISAKKILGK